MFVPNFRNVLNVFFTARRYASAVYDVIMCPSVPPSQAGTVSK